MAVMWWWLRRLKRRAWPLYRSENRRARRNGEPARMVFIGDSITARWRTADPALFAGGILCRGIGGETSGDMLGRFPADVIALRPAAVHIMAGTNDIARQAPDAALAGLKRNVAAMAERARAAGIGVLLASTPPARRFPKYPDRVPAPTIAAFNAWLRAYAAEHGHAYVDYHAALADAAGAMREGLAADGVHPLPAGYAVMRPIALAAIARVP